MTKKINNNHNKAKIMARKSIEIETTENGIKYFSIYELRVKTQDGETITYDRYLNRKDAEESQDFVYKHLGDLYEESWIRVQMVWC